MELTTDPKDPRLEHQSQIGQHEVYLVLSEEERAKGFVRPVRRSYRHVGAPGPTYELHDLTEEQRRIFPDYAKYEPYPESELPKTAKYWTQAELDNIGKGCGEITSMGQALAETYARQPSFYGFTFCSICNKHLPVEEFIWLDGSRLGS